MLIAALRLIRFPNLVVVAITQWLVAKKVLEQAYQQENIAPILSGTELGLLIFATVTVAAIGYLVNDIADLPIDRINRPDKVIIGERISKKGAQLFSYVLAAIGLAVTLFLALQKGELEWLWLYPLFVGLLILYPGKLKHHPVIGNVFVALACAGVAGLIWLAERAAWNHLSGELQNQTAFLLSMFMLYGFISTWIREIVKDLEDEKGDRSQGRNSLVISWGATTAKYFSFGLSLILLVSLAALMFTVVYQKLNFFGQVLVPVLMLITLILARRLSTAESTEDYHHLSQYWKYYLLGGLTVLLCYQL